MKLNLEIELDWIDDEMTLDDVVKQNIINSVVGKIQKKVETQVEETINSTINKTIADKINKMTENLFNDFINKEVVISDSYGDILKTYNNVNELIKERFDKFMTQDVDNDGDIYTGSYGSKHTRLTYIIDKQLKEFADEFTTNAVKQVSEEIKNHVKEGLTNKLGSELMKVLKVDKMLELSNGK